MIPFFNPRFTRIYSKLPRATFTNHVPIVAQGPLGLNSCTRNLMGASFSSRTFSLRSSLTYASKAPFLTPWTANLSRPTTHHAPSALRPHLRRASPGSLLSPRRTVTSSHISAPTRSLAALARLLVSGSALLLLLLYLRHPENHLTPLLSRTLLLLDPEHAHRLAVALCSTPLCLPHTDPALAHHPRLAVPGPLPWTNPIGLAAGFDKHAQAIEGLHVLGFGALEVGSVTPLPQAGQARPRVFRVPESQAVINRYGFNSEGHARALYRLVRARQRQPRVACPVGVNLGKNKDGDVVADYVEGVQTFRDVADYLVVNVSSPNTPGLRAVLADPTLLQKLLVACTAPHLRGPPLLVKVCVDGFDDDGLRELAHILRQFPIAGVILGNTTVRRPEGLEGDPATLRQSGGLSGPPLKPLHLHAIRILYPELRGIPIVGCGGISSAQDALDYARAGAHAVQLYTGLVYHGPQLVHRILTDLVDYFESHGTTWAETIGSDHRA